MSSALDAHVRARMVGGAKVEFPLSAGIAYRLKFLRGYRAHYIVIWQCLRRLVPLKRRKGSELNIRQDRLRPADSHALLYTQPPGKPADRDPHRDR